MKQKLQRQRESKKGVHGKIIQGTVHSEVPTRDLGGRFESHHEESAPIHSRCSSTYTHAFTAHKYHNLFSCMV